MRAEPSIGGIYRPVLHEDRAGGVDTIVFSTRWLVDMQEQIKAFEIRDRASIDSCGSTSGYRTASADTWRSCSRGVVTLPLTRVAEWWLDKPLSQ